MAFKMNYSKGKSFPFKSTSAFKDDGYSPGGNINKSVNFLGEYMLSKNTGKKIKLQRY